MYRNGRIGSAWVDFSLAYGSVWELNAGYREESTDRALVTFLETVGREIQSLEVHNYSHCPSTILDVSTRPAIIVHTAYKGGN